LEGEHVRVAGKYDVKQSSKAKIPDWLSNHQYIFDGVDNPCSEINTVIDRYEQKGFPPDTKVKAPLHPIEEGSSTKLYQVAVTYAKQQAFTDAERCFRELVTRRDEDYEADSRTWIEIMDDYQQLLEMNHPDTYKQFEKRKEKYQQRFPVDFIKGIFDPRGLLTAPASPVHPTPVPATPASAPVTPAVNPKTAWILAKNLDAKGFAELGRKLVWDDNMPEAGLVALDRAITLGEVGKSVYFNRAEAYSRLGDYRTAIENGDVAIALDPKDHAGYYNRGLEYRNLQQYQRAIEDFDRAIQIKHDYTDAYVNRGSAYDDLKQYQRAIEDFDRAIQLKPDYADAYYNRGNACYNLQQYQRAIADYDRAIKLKPDYADAYINRGNAYSNLQQYQRAIEDFDRTIQLKRDFADAYDTRGLAYYHLKQYERAIEDFDRAIQLKPDLVEAYNGRGEAYEALGNMAQAQADYCKALQLNPNYEYAKGNLKRNGWVC